MSDLISPQSSREKLLVIQPLVGIGDMVWHKPWIDYLCTQNDVILADADGLVDILPIDRSQRGTRGRHDGWRGFWQLVADFKSTGARRALILHHSPRYAIAAYFARMTSRWGYGIGRQLSLIHI